MCVILFRFMYLPQTTTLTLYLQRTEFVTNIYLHIEILVASIRYGYFTKPNRFAVFGNKFIF